MSNTEVILYVVIIVLSLLCGAGILFLIKNVRGILKELGKIKGQNKPKSKP